MRVVIQRVTSAKVTVASELISQIGPGLCVLVGIAKGDTMEDVNYIVRKLLNIRLFDGPLLTTSHAAEADNQPCANTTPPPPRWKRNVKDCDYSLLCVSQFTLCCQLKGNKPDYHMAMPPQDAHSLYERLLAQLRAAYQADRIVSGKFGAYMQVEIVNDGPVTVEVESPRKDVVPEAGSLPLAAADASK